MEMSDTVMFNRIEPIGPISFREQPPFRRCRDIRREMYVRWNGNVPVCGMQYLVDQEEWITNLNTSTILDAWHHPLLNNRRSQQQHGGSAILTFCTMCSHTT